MDLKNAAKNVLNKIYAGKEEDGTQEQETEKIPAPDTGPQGKTLTYLFFTAKPGEKINYSNIYEEVKDKGNTLFSKLRDGNFFWKNLVLRTNEYEASPSEEFYIYSVDLNRDGSPIETTQSILDSNNKTIDPSNNKNYETILNKIKSMAFDNNILSFGYNPVYVSRGYSNNDLVRIAKGTPIAGAINSDENFNNAYHVSSYRIRTMPGVNIPAAGNNQEILVGPKYELPTPEMDNFAGKNVAFLGTKEQMEMLKKAVSQGYEEKPKEEPQPSEQSKEEKTNFNPIDEQKPMTKDEATNKFAKDDKDSMIKELKKDDPDANYYTGDNSVMQDLVRRQHKKMKIRRANITTSTPATTPTAPSSSSSKGPSIPVHDMSKAKENEENAKKLGDLAKKQQQMNQEVKKINDQINRTVTASSVESVLSKYLKK